MGVSTSFPQFSKASDHQVLNIHVAKGQLSDMRPTVMPIMPSFLQEQKVMHSSCWGRISHSSMVTFESRGGVGGPWVCCHHGGLPIGVKNVAIAPRLHGKRVGRPKRMHCEYSDEAESELVAPSMPMISRSLCTKWWARVCDKLGRHLKYSPEVDDHTAQETYILLLLVPLVIQLPRGRSPKLYPNIRGVWNLTTKGPRTSN
jgi:hypothetical protein